MRISNLDRYRNSNYGNGNSNAAYTMETHGDFVCGDLMYSGHTFMTLTNVLIGLKYVDRSVRLLNVALRGSRNGNGNSTNGINGNGNDNEYLVERISLLLKLLLVLCVPAQAYFTLAAR